MFLRRIGMALACIAFSFHAWAVPAQDSILPNSIAIKITHAYYLSKNLVEFAGRVGLKLTATDREFLLSHSLHRMPVLMMSARNFRIGGSPSKVVVKFLDVAKGQFSVNGHRFTFDAGQSLRINTLHLLRVLGHSLASNNFLFVRRAHADTAGLPKFLLAMTLMAYSSSQAAMLRAINSAPSCDKQVKIVATSLHNAGLELRGIRKERGNCEIQLGRPGHNTDYLSILERPNFGVWATHFKFESGHFQPVEASAYHYRLPDNELISINTMRNQNAPLPTITAHTNRAEFERRKAEFAPYRQIQQKMLNMYSCEKCGNELQSLIAKSKDGKNISDQNQK